MLKDTFKTTQEKLKTQYNIDIVEDVILSESNEVILFAIASDTSNIVFDVISGSLSIFGFDDHSTFSLNALIQAIDTLHAYAIIAGEEEYVEHIKAQLLNVKQDTYVTIPVALKGSRHWIRYHTVPISKYPNAVAVFMTNITPLMKEEESLFNKMHRDSLTQIFNKYTLDYHYGLRYLNPDFHVVFLDLDNFKCLNDALGHEVGNNYLRDFSNILKKYEKGHNRFYRIGGDEFVGLFFQPTNVILKIASNLLKETKELSSIYAYNETTVSMGIVKADKRDDVIKKADTLLYLAKAAGKNTFVFQEEHQLSL